MPKIHLETTINAPIERVFDLARCIDLHTKSLSQTNEKAIDGVTTGLINLGESVTWQATHFGIKQNLTSKITKFERPTYFRDSMVAGAFSRFDHDHFFSTVNHQTIMRDVFDYDSPLGFLGRIADSLFLKNYMKNLLNGRNELIKQVAESDEWKMFLAS